MPDEEKIAKEATEWFVHFLEPSGASRTGQHFSRWLLQSPRHIQAYLDVARTWQGLEHVHYDISVKELIRAARLDTSRLDDAIWPAERQSASRPGGGLRLVSRHDGSRPRNGRSRRADCQSSSPKHIRAVPDAKQQAHPRQDDCLLKSKAPGSRSQHRAMWAIAASVLIAIVSIGAITFNHALSASRYQTAIGEQRALVLEDGSHIQLNTDTQLSLAWSATERRVNLSRGEARFTVIKDSARPFIVTTPHAAVRAVGTIFNVRTTSRRTAVVVIEGLVAVYAVTATPENSFSLSTGERATMSESGHFARNTGPALEHVEAWPKRRIVFQDEALANVIAELNRYHQRPLRIADPGLAGMEISGTFSSDDPTALLDFLRRYHRVRVHTNSQGEQVLGRPPY